MHVRDFTQTSRVSGMFGLSSAFSRPFEFERHMNVCFLTGRCSLEQEDAGRTSEMGKPVLGERNRLKVVVDESRDFKVQDLRRPARSCSEAHDASLNPCCLTTVVPLLIDPLIYCHRSQWTNS